MAQVQSLHTADSRMRDVKRRVEVIQKKVADLQDMGVPCAFCYSSVRNPGSIFTIGDKRITEVMERYRNKILCNLMDGSHVGPADTESSSQEIHLILPVLPAPLSQLNRTTLQSMIIGILKDLDIRWSDPKPIWWPVGIPFVPLRSVPDNFTGNWISALKEVLKSVYSYFSYDIDSYITSELEMQSGPQTNEVEQGGSDTEEGGSSGQDERGSGNELEGRSNEVVPVQVTKSSSTIRNTAPKTSSNKAISSFTVENILMGKQSPNSCSSSTPASSQSPTSSAAASLPSPTPLGPISSSVVGVNWVSHPPVKYTKFTILSPTAMSEEAKRKKSMDSSPRIVSARPEESTEARTTTSNTVNYCNGKQLQQLVYARQTSSDVPMTSTPVYSFSSSSTIKELNASTPLSSSAKICTLPVVTTLQSSSSGSDGKVMLSKSFPPPQQYVLLVPSSSATVTSVVQSVPHKSPGKEFLSTSVGNSVKHSSLKTVTFQNPPAATSTSFSSSSSSSKDLGVNSSSGGGYCGPGGERLERGSIGNQQSNEYNFRLIAPKQKHRVSGGSNATRGRFKLHGRAPQKLRFHMTTVVTKQKKVPVKSSMTVESPSVVAVGNPQNANTARPTAHSHSSEGSVPMESRITRSPNVYSSAPSKAVKKEAPDLESCTFTQVEDGRTASQNSTIHNGSSPSRNYRTGSTTEDVRTAGSLKHNDSINPQPPFTGTRHRGRTTRSYTRRKRELTFHLYEDPGTAFKAKRACKE